ncbi:MAG: serine/threonine protein kinase, partial [Planctomycetales bacterium]|nr:serine/threonine protein kinase [Planctomycetales bacterium]
MLASQSCFTRQQLRDYLTGLLDEAVADEIESHLHECDSCDTTLAELDGESDTMLRTLRLRQAAGEGNAAESGARVAPAEQSEPSWVESLAASEGSAPHLAETAMPSISQLGDYELLRVLGRGGMSVVFAGRHRHLGREVAVKVMATPDGRPGMSRDRFAREMRAVGALDHPAIVRATDAGECRDTLYLVMELVDGVDLATLSRRVGPLEVSDACQIMAEAARGLAFAHRQDVVHRDVKPSNLMVDSSGCVKLLDFGLARSASAPGELSMQTSVGQLLGTLDYMAPEQSSDSKVDAQADVYACGATLFKLLTGAPPHGRSADCPVLEYLHRLANHEAPDIRELRPDVPRDLAELIAHMLRRDPSQRGLSCDEVADRLSAHAADANLPKLVDAASSPPSNDEQDAEDVRTGLLEIWRNAVPEVEGKPMSPKSIAAGSLDAAPRWLSPLGVALFASLALLGVWGAIILYLKTDVGELVVESDVVDAVHVRMLSEGNARSSSIEATTGSTTVQVRSGRYELRLDTGADGVELSPSSLVIKRGGRVVAKVRRITSASSTASTAGISDAANAADISGVAAQPPVEAEGPPTQPVFEGKTFEHWQAAMRFERSPNPRAMAAVRVLQLTSTRPKEEAFAAAIEAVAILWRNEVSSDESLAAFILAHRSDAELQQPEEVVAAMAQR